MRIEELKLHVFGLSIAFESVLQTNPLSILEKYFMLNCFSMTFPAHQNFFTIHYQEEGCVKWGPVNNLCERTV